MSKATVKKAVKVNEVVAESYRAAATVGEGAARDFIKSAAAMLKARKVTVTVMQDTVKAEQSKVSFIIKSSHVQDIARAAEILETVKGADSVKVTDVLKLARNLRDKSGRTAAEADKALRDAVQSGDDFAKIQKDTAAEVKAQNAAGKDDDGDDMTGGNVTGDDIVRAALNALRGLDVLTVTDLQSAEALVKVLRQAVKNGQPVAA